MAPLRSDDPGFNARFQKRFDKLPDAPTALAYDAVALLADAIRRAGSPEGEKIRAALAATRDYRGVSGTFSIGADRNPVKPIGVFNIKDAAFVDAGSVTVQ